MQPLPTVKNGESAQHVQRYSRLSKMPNRMQDPFTLETVHARHHIINTKAEEDAITVEEPACVCTVENNFRV